MCHIVWSILVEEVRDVCTSFDQGSLTKNLLWMVTILWKIDEMGSWVTLYTPSNLA